LESKSVKALRNTSCNGIRFCNPRRSTSARVLIQWRLSDRKSRQKQRIDDLLFDESDSPDRRIPRHKLRRGIRRRLRRATHRDARPRVLHRRQRAGSRRIHHRR
jgi:hypothetical protein